MQKKLKQYDGRRNGLVRGPIEDLLKDAVIDGIGMELAHVITEFADIDVPGLVGPIHRGLPFHTLHTFIEGRR